LLVSRLYKLFGGNVPKPERSIFNFKDCPRGEGIWDILGYYDSKSYSVTICEPKIEEHSWQVATRLGSKPHETRLVLRELVRLHEHAHSLIHTGNFDEFRGFNLSEKLPEFKVKCRFKMGYPIPCQINEPLAEFISWSIIHNIADDEARAIFEKVFDEVDKSAPSYYKNWVQLRQLIQNSSKPASEHFIFFVPGLVHIARDGVWNNFGHFVQAISSKYELLQERYMMLKAREVMAT